MKEMGGSPVSLGNFSAWWHGGGKLSAADKFELSWKQFGKKTDGLLDGVLDGARDALKK